MYELTSQQTKEVAGGNPVLWVLEAYVVESVLHPDSIADHLAKPLFKGIQKDIDKKKESKQPCPK